MSKTDFFEFQVGNQHRECIEVETDYERGVMDERKRWEAKQCKSCKYFLPDDGLSCGHDDVVDFDTPAYIQFSGCGLHQPIPQ
jgi:hypothetical protein